MSVFIAICAIIAVIGLWITNFIVGALVFDVGHSGQFGDMFGAINSAFSGFALVGIIYGIVIQNKQLKAAQMEAEEERALRHKSEFENNFYNMIGLFSDLTANIDLRNIETNVVVNSGKDCFCSFMAHICIMIDNIPAENISNADIYDESYDSYYISRHGDLGHYFRSMYNILKYIDTSSIENKKFYTNIVRAQLSDYEVSVLFFNCMSSRGREKMKTLVERYSMLKHFSIPEGTAVFEEKINILKGNFHPNAFGI